MMDPLRSSGMSVAAGADGQEDGGLAQVLSLLLALLLWNRYPASPSYMWW